MNIRVQFHSYFCDLAGCRDAVLPLRDGADVAELLREAHARFPKLAGTARATLVAVGLEYAPLAQALREGDEVSLFPPVQGG